MFYMFKRKFKSKIILSIFIISLLSLASTLSTITVQTQISSLVITAKTDKNSYLLRQKVVIEGNITMDGTPITNVLIIMQILNPLNQSLAYRTITHGSVSQDLPIQIINVYITDLHGNQLNTVKIGSAVKVCVTVHNPQLTSRSIYVTITVFDANFTPIQAEYLATTIQQKQTITTKFTVYIPKWSTSGRALICANVYSKEPKEGGLALSQEKTVYFCISKTQQGLLEYPDLPPPQSQTTPGFYKTYIRISPEPKAGEYELYVKAQYTPTVISSTSTIFNVQNSVGYPPQASFAYWPAKPYENMTVQFDASSSTPEGFNDTITKYEWDFGDGTPKIVKSEPIITHKYMTPGKYIITLNVTDSEGLWSTTSKPITIYPEFGPTARFTWTPKTPTVNATVTFNASDSTPGWSKIAGGFSPIKSYTWNFGDGTGDITVTTPIIYHNFIRPGNYTVTLTVTDAVNRKASVSALIEVLNITLKDCDFNGDGFIDMLDVRMAAKAFGAEHITNQADPRYCQYWHSPPCASCPHSSRIDLVKDGFIDMLDVRIVAKNFGKDP